MTAEVVIRYLLDHGADVNARAVHNLTPALYASEIWSQTQSDSLRLIWQYMADAGADPNAVDDLGNNIFLRAIPGPPRKHRELPSIIDEGEKNGGCAIGLE